MVDEASVLFEKVVAVVFVMAQQPLQWPGGAAREDIPKLEGQTVETNPTEHPPSERRNEYTNTDPRRLSDRLRSLIRPPLILLRIRKKSRPKNGFGAEVNGTHVSPNMTQSLGPALPNGVIQNPPAACAGGTTTNHDNNLVTSLHGSAQLQNGAAADSDGQGGQDDAQPCEGTGTLGSFIEAFDPYGAQSRFASALLQTRKELMERFKDLAILEAKDFPTVNFKDSDEIMNKFKSKRKHIQALINTSKSGRYADRDPATVFLKYAANDREKKPVIVVDCSTEKRAKSVSRRLKECDTSAWPYPYRIVWGFQLFGPAGELKIDISTCFLVKTRPRNDPTPSQGILLELFIRDSDEEMSHDSPSDVHVGRATLGGIISVGGSLYGMTVAHPFIGFDGTNLADLIAHASVEPGKPTILRDNDAIAPEDPFMLVGSIVSYGLGAYALIPDRPSPLSDFQLHQNSSESELPESREKGTLYGPDWALVQVHESKILQDFVRSVEDLPSQYQTKEEIYQTLADGMEIPIRVMAGASGIIEGRVTPGCGSMQLGWGWFDVFVISLDRPLAKGDSGSWVRCGEDVLGYVVGGSDSPALAYMVAIEDAFISIRETLNVDQVKIPSERSTEQARPSELLKTHVGNEGVLIWPGDSPDSTTPEELAVSVNLGDMFLSDWIPRRTALPDRYLEFVRERSRVISPSRTDSGEAPIVRSELLFGGDLPSPNSLRLIHFCSTEEDAMALRKRFGGFNTHNLQYFLTDQTTLLIKESHILQSPLLTTPTSFVSLRFGADARTLCGRIGVLHGVEHDYAELSQVSVGGVLKVDGKLYGLIVFAGHAIVSPARVMDDNLTHRIPSQDQSGDAAPNIELSCPFWLYAAGNGFAWGLFSLPSWALLPNSRKLPVHKEPIFVESFAKRDAWANKAGAFSHAKVHIEAASGPRLGLLSSEKVDLHLDTSLLEVYRVTMASALVPGDAGAWVIRNEDLCGIIVAGSGSLPWAYMLPMDTVLNSMYERGLQEISMPALTDFELLATDANGHALPAGSSSAAPMSSSSVQRRRDEGNNNNVKQGRDSATANGAASTQSSAVSGSERIQAVTPSEQSRANSRTIVGGPRKDHSSNRVPPPKPAISLEAQPDSLVVPTLRPKDTHPRNSRPQPLRAATSKSILAQLQRSKWLISVKEWYTIMRTLYPNVLRTEPEEDLSLLFPSSALFMMSRSLMFVEAVQLWPLVILSSGFSPKKIAKAIESRKWLHPYILIRVPLLLYCGQAILGVVATGVGFGATGTPDLGNRLASVFKGLGSTAMGIGGLTDLLLIFLFLVILNDRAARDGRRQIQKSHMSGLVLVRLTSQIQFLAGLGILLSAVFNGPEWLFGILGFILFAFSFLAISLTNTRLRKIFPKSEAYQQRRTSTPVDDEIALEAEVPAIPLDDLSCSSNLTSVYRAH